jgi:hypothetical protein
MKSAELMAYLTLILALYESGKLTAAKLRSFLAQEGATAAQLADLDVRLTEAINQRESEA